MTTTYYTGIGARLTPQPILELMERIARELAPTHRLRSGGATGADQAFGRGAGANADIFLPWEDFGQVEPGATSYIREPIPSDVWAIVRNLHPAPGNLNPAARRLHARNVYQVLGPGPGKQPSAFLICWTKGGEKVGGTATAIKLAEIHHVPVFNLAIDYYQQAFLRPATAAVEWLLQEQNRYV